MTPKPNGITGASPWHGRKNQACPLQPCLVLRRMKVVQNPNPQQQQAAAAVKQQAACGKQRRQQRQPLVRKWL